jgi:predicted transcriptional regulator
VPRADRITKFDITKMEKLADKGWTYKAIGAELECSAGTVSRYLRRTGRAAVRDTGNHAMNASPAAPTNKQKRAEIATRLLEECEDLLDAMKRPYKMYAAGGKDFHFEEQVVEEPLPRDKADLIRAAVQCLDEHRKLTDFDSEDGAAGAKSVLLMFAKYMDMEAERLDGGNVTVGEILQGTAEDV